MAVRTIQQLRDEMAVGVAKSISAQDIQNFIDTVENRTLQTFLVKTASYTAADTDNRCRITFNSASAVTLTLPATLPVGWECFVIQLGAGQVTIAATGGAVNARDGHTKLAGQYASAYLAVYANAGTAPQVVLSGDTAA